MGRTPKVSRETALRAAMHLFWSRGFNATTMDEIQVATGLQRGSIYAYFQTKEKLFHETLELYHQEVVLERRLKVRSAPTAKQGIELFFKILIEHPLKNPSFPGCLNTNSATELARLDEEIYSRSKRGLISWEEFWVEILNRAKSEGDLAKDKSSIELARLLITVTQGINVVSKVNAESGYLKGIVRSALTFFN